MKHPDVQLANWAIVSISHSWGTEFRLSIQLIPISTLVLHLLLLFPASVDLASALNGRGRVSVAAVCLIPFSATWPTLSRFRTTWSSLINWFWALKLEKKVGRITAEPGGDAGDLNETICPEIYLHSSADESSPFFVLSSEQEPRSLFPFKITLSATVYSAGCVVLSIVVGL